MVKAADGEQEVFLLREIVDNGEGVEPRYTIKHAKVMGVRAELEAEYQITRLNRGKVDAEGRSLEVSVLQRRDGPPKSELRRRSADRSC